MIAVFSAVLLGFLTQRLDDRDQAADVAADRLSSVGGADRVAEVEAFTNSWHFTQIAVGAVCLILSVVVAVLLRTSRPGTTGVGGGDSVRPG